MNVFRRDKGTVSLKNISLTKTRYINSLLLLLLLLLMKTSARRGVAFFPVSEAVVTESVDAASVACVYDGAACDGMHFSRRIAPPAAFVDARMSLVVTTRGA